MSLRTPLLLIAMTITSGAAEPSPALDSLPIDHGRITRVQHLDDPTQEVPGGAPIEHLPPRTIVDVELTPEPGARSRTEVWLPEPAHWNGRFLGLGNGGAAGKINQGALAGALRGGWAVAQSDLGTAPDASSGNGNPAVWRDFGHRATHLMTVVGKQLVAAQCGRAPQFSYFNGGSTGGQQALQEAQRHPDDYDGIVSSVPAHCRAPLHAYFLWNHQILTRCPFTKEQNQAVIDAANAYVAPRETPQTAGKLVSDPRHTAADITAVIALARQRDPSLTDAHAAALQQLFDGPRHARTGERIFDGIPFGSTFDIAHGNLYLFHWVFGAQKDLLTIDWDRDIDRYLAALGPDLNAENPDLALFHARGGKLIIVTGSADSCVPFHATLDYYDRVVEHTGSLAATQEFARLYLIPGMSHGPGPGINNLPDTLDLVKRWREEGQVPDTLRGRRVVEGKTEMEFPIPPYPARTTWSEASGFAVVPGQQGGVARVAERFLNPR